MQPEARARAALALTLCMFGAACGSDSTAPTDHFSIVSPATSIAAGQQTGLCYHFRTPNTTEIAVKQWKSQFGTGIARIVVVLTATDQKTPGTQSTTNCGAFAPLASAGTLHPTWAYTASTPTAQYTFPADDGTGKPLGMIIPPAQPGFIYIEFVNPTDETLSSRVHLDAVAYNRGTAVTGVKSFVTYNGSLSIPANSSNTSFTQGCAVSPTSKFIWMTTYSNKQSVQTSIKDGATTAFQSTDWSNPGSTEFDAPFFTFSSGLLTHTFVYTNPTSSSITDGGDFTVNELGVTLSYFFPATESKYCIDGTVF